MPWFNLRRIDRATMGFTHALDFETDKIGTVMDFIDVGSMDAGDCYDLDGKEYLAFVRYFKLDLPEDAELAEISWHHDDDFDRRPTHTGRELLLMLEGRKPFAAFIDEAQSRDRKIIPEDLFEPYVASGRFSKRVVVEPFHVAGKTPIPMRRVMYAAIGQEWRFEAFLSLWAMAQKYGWNDGFEKLEGFIYGYETDLDPFFDPSVQSPLQP
jgi:hypothetical protein